ncbi:diaminobutyrate acetyltransferase [Marinobacter bryozoorum]|jgi:L-2,4-diaminobutyric acid acetyltransferase|uniref:diaminobutyrate acetyltransferase n=1 Tax=Marinobacter bryozoorum TaxID=256324 RepID=UPI0020047144|nr:diaminobutyrate acetyltransferase [Marinobacter bryozoorum]MCK7545208.1 diaminobutyrate acetyltransferase [Marinobacter bryozoorum]
MTTEGSNTTAITFRAPVKDDGYKLHNLVGLCPPLDPNSIYCNLLQCSHFAQTGVAAEMDGELVGFISGYIPPEQPDTLFIWQVAVHEKGRGQGLAKRMLKEIVKRDACRNVKFLETTITEDNDASWALFRSFARDMGAELTYTEHFEKELHFGGEHDSEFLLRIGPFTRKG